MAPDPTQTRTAVVTGASSGIGAASARALAAQGFHVVCAARRTDRIEELAAEIGGTAVTCDINDADSVAALAAALPVCHVLVNNAGGAVGTDRVEDADLEDWRWMYDVNVLGLVRVTQALLPALRASGDAVIVNIGSTAGRWAYEGGAGYTAAKHAVKVVSETLRLELNGEPIRRERLIKTDGTGFMSAILPSGMRAVAISIDTRGASSAGGFVLPNDRVDVIRTWRDEESSKAQGVDVNLSETILHNIARRAAADAELYVIEGLPEAGEEKVAMVNLGMAVTTGGRQRSLDEYAELLGRAGFAIRDVLPCSRYHSIVRAERACDGRLSGQV